MSGWGRQGGVELDEAIAQAETERDAGALLLRDCGSPIDTRSLDDRDDLPRIIRAGRHLARPKRYIPGLPIDIEDEIAAARRGGRAGATRRRLGQAGRRLDRPRHRRFGAAVVRRHADRGDRRRPRQRRAGHRARLRRGRAARSDQGGNRLHRTRHRAHRRHHRVDGRTRNRPGAHADQRREFSRHRRCRGEVSDVRRAHARLVRELLSATCRSAGRPACRSTPAPTQAA